MSIFKKTEADKAVEAAIEKHAGKVAGLILIAAAAFGLNSCMTPETPEEIRAGELGQYLSKCEWWGFTYEAYELGGEQKYKDYSYVTYMEYIKKREDKDSTMPVEQCRLNFEKGRKAGAEAVKAGRVDML